jgi:hypothetical protein
MQWAIQRSQPVSWTCIVFMFDGGPVSWTGQVFLVKHSCNVFMWSRNQCSSMQRQRQKRLLLWGSRIAYVYSQYKAGIYYSSPLTIDILCCIHVYVCFMSMSSSTCLYFVRWCVRTSQSQSSCPDLALFFCQNAKCPPGIRYIVYSDSVPRSILRDTRHFTQFLQYTSSARVWYVYLVSA